MEAALKTDIAELHNARLAKRLLRDYCTVQDTTRHSCRQAHIPTLVVSSSNGQVLEGRMYHPRVTSMYESVRRGSRFSG